MNDLDMMRNIECCINHNCDKCDYHTEEASYCAANMMKDANTILHMQHDALKGFSEELEKLTEENARLKTMAKFPFDERTLVEKVNDIVYACMDDFDDYDDGGHAYVRMLEKLLAFGAMLPGQYKVVISGIKCPPELVKE